MKSQALFVHPTAHIEKGAVIGKGTKIWHNVHITSTAQIGENCIIARNCYVAGIIGNGSKLQNNVNIYKGVTLGDYVFCGPNMTFTNDLNPRAKYPKHGKWLDTKVESGVTFGAGSVILSGISIGKWAMIGAGSIVTKNVPSYGLLYGVPAQLHSWVCECGNQMPKTFKKHVCNFCKKVYKQLAGNVEEIIL